MNTEAIYKLADEMTDEQLDSIVSSWSNDDKKMKTFDILVRLGDSRKLACATIFLQEPISKEVLDDYKFAYES